MASSKLYIILILLLGFPLVFYAQSDYNGQVSYITSDNVYVRFSTTDDITIGDTLFFNEAPCLEVIKKSSTSCICQKISNCKVQKDNNLVFKGSHKDKKDEVPKDTKDSILVDEATQILELQTSEEINEDFVDSQYKQRMNVRTSIGTYSSLSPFENNNKHRLVGRVSMNIDNINNSRFSIQSYLNYRQNLDTNAISTTIAEKLRIYNLAISYDVDSTLQLSVGRKINRNLSSIGAIDGIQFEKQFNTFITGAVLGFRPDFVNFGFNTNLLEYGAFVGNKFSSKSINSRITLGILEQRNAGSIDRRYMHIQSTQSINRKLNLFGSIEFDLYSRINDISSFKPRLTNLYLSTRYRFNRMFSVTLSYDNRKRIIFYETFRTDVERLLDDDVARQGLRLRMNIRPMNKILAGASFSQRFQSNSDNKSVNINTFVSLTRFPIEVGTLSLRYNRNVSNYLISNIYSTTYSFYSFKNKLNTQLYFRNVHYDYFASENKSLQNYYGANLYLRITKSLRFGLLFEVSDRQENRYYRINTKLIKRFNKK